MNKNLKFPCLLSAIFVSAAILQSTLVFNWDNSQILYATKLFLHGGSYVHDFFIPNPPLIFYLYSPTVLLSELLGLNIIIIFRIYIFILAIFSFYLCAILSKNIFKPQDKSLSKGFLLSIAFIYFILPMHEFGQRDTLLLLLTLPYGLATATRLEGNKLKPIIAFSVGILAAFGFLIKPHFFLTLIIIETYYLINRGRVLPWLRIETVTVGCITALYLLAVALHNPEYIFVMIPYLIKYYHKRTDLSLLELITLPATLYCLISIAIYLAILKYNQYRKLSTILLLMLFAFLFSFVSQQVDSFYHVLPALSITILLQILLFERYLTSNLKIKQNLIILIPISLIVLFLYVDAHATWVYLVFDPIITYTYFACIAFLLLYSIHKKILKCSILVCLIMSIVIYCSYLISHISWYQYHFVLVIALYCALCGLLTANGRYTLTRAIFTTFLALAMFEFPVLLSINGYKVQSSYNQNVLQPLIHFFNTQKKHSSLLVLSIKNSIATPLVDYVDINIKGRIDCIWMVNILVELLHKYGERYTLQYIQNNQDNYFFVNIIADDLNTKAPDFVLVDVSNQNVFWHNKLEYFDFIKYFVANQKFAKAWQNYAYLTAIESKSFNSFTHYNFKLAVYQRKNSGQILNR